MKQQTVDLIKTSSVHALIRVRIEKMLLTRRTEQLHHGRIVTCASCTACKSQHQYCLLKYKLKINKYYYSYW